MSLTELNIRSRDIFRRIVETYLETGDPVGSRTISRAGDVSLSPATIRNVMSDLEDMGLISAPHTSAGRVPTDIGLRLFVDGLMQVGHLSEGERAELKVRAADIAQEPEAMLQQATRALSGLSHCASLVLAPTEDLAVRHIEFVPLAPDRALVVLVGDQERVENRVINLPPGMPASALTQAANYLNWRMGGRTLAEVVADIQAELATRSAELDSLSAKVVEAGLAVWSGETEDASGNSRLIVSGQANLLENVAATEDLERVRRLLDDLERKNELIRILDLARSGEGVRLFIGSETNLFSLSGSSLVAAPYMKADNSVIGVIGIIGPTRLNYARIIPMVDYTARALSRLF